MAWNDELQRYLLWFANKRSRSVFQRQASPARRRDLYQAWRISYAQYVVENRVICRMVGDVLSFANLAVPSSSGVRAVKVCGLISEHDAAMVARSFRAIAPSSVHLLLGMILWPHSRRSITQTVARRIAGVAEKYDATPVGVFVDEDTESIERTCKDCGIQVAQLHGPKCRSAWHSVSTETSLEWIDVRDVDANGVVSPETASNVGPPLWSLYDASGGGTGKPFDWDNFTPPDDPWLLAGGLDPENVREAVAKLRPNGVDVASGVAGPDKCAKDEKRVRLFLERLSDAYA